MPIMTWNDGLDIGVEPMNLEHRQILDVMNRIYDASSGGVVGPTINDLMTELAQVCSRHFAHEESYMAEVGYPTLATHKQLHAQLLARVGQYAQAIRANGGRTTEELFDFLRFWLTSHIKGIDTKYAAHAHGAG